MTAAAPLLTAALLVLALPPSPRPWAGAVALLPLAVALGGLPGGRAGARRAWATGGATGAVAWAVLLAWIVPSLRTLHPLLLAVAVWVAVVGLLALHTGLAARIVHRLHAGHRLPLVLALPVGWTAVEWLRAHLGDLSFPWLELAGALVGEPALLAPAEWSGARGLSFWMAAVSGGAADLLTGRSDRRRHAALVLPLLVLPALWGHWRVRTLETRPVGEVLVAGLSLPAAPGGPAERSERALLRVRTLLRGEAPAVLAVLPEAVVRLPGAEGVELVSGLGEVADSLSTPILAGAYLGAAGEGGVANGALLLVPGAGEAGRYEKRRLVPGVERAPFLAPAGGPGAFRAGEEGTVLEVPAGPRVGVLVCFESLFGGLARAYRREGADALVALTDDAWLAASGPLAPGVLEQHAAHLLLRAAETRVGIVRAANRGWVGVADPLGDWVGTRIPPGREGVLRAGLRTTDVTTPYVRWGDLVGSGSALLAALALTAAAVGRRRGRDRNSAPSRGWTG